MNGVDSIDTSKIYMGVLAQDLLKMGITSAVRKSSSGFYKVNYNKIDANFGVMSNL